MKNIKNTSATKENNFRLFFQLSFFALFAIMSLFSGQTLAQQTCTPSTTVTEGDLFPGGLASFGVASEPGSVTVDHVNAGTGTQSLTVVGVPINAIVNIPPFVPGTFDPVVVTFTTPNPALPVDFTLRATSQFHAIFIRVRCGMVSPTPTPVASPTPTPGASPTPTPAASPTPTPGGPTTFSGRAISVNATFDGVNTILNDTGNLPPMGGFISRSLASGNLFGGALTTGLLNAITQGAFDQSRSQAIVENLNLMAGGNLITADLVPASSQCTCFASGPPVCEGGVMIAVLRINGVQIPIVGVNQTVNLPSSGFIIINEQIRSPRTETTASLTVNALRISTPALPGFPSTSDVIISSAHSDINCGIFQ